MAFVFKKIVSLARKRTHNPLKEENLLQELLPKMAVVVPEDGGGVERLADVFRGLSTKAYNSYVLEIGFGSGENILSLAKNNPDMGVMGCEVFRGGVVKLLEAIKTSALENIRIWHDDALELIPRLPLNSLSLIYILHPDPWPKRKHHNRRLVNSENLKLLASRMLVGGKLLIITDHENYAQHIARVIPEVLDLFDLEFDLYPEIVKTKYRLKAESKGIESKYFCLVKK